MDVQQLQDKANAIREDVIKMLVEAGSGHSAGPLGMADVFTALYFGGILAYRADDPGWEERDRLVLSAGHIVPILYVTLAQAGFFPREELATLRKLDSRLQGHPHHEVTRDKNPVATTSLAEASKVGNDPAGRPHQWAGRQKTNATLPGIENSAGPLGQGTSVACGMALALRMNYAVGKLSRLPKVICVTGDGELQEGQCWEAFMFAAANKLDGLTFVIDRNHIQIDGYTEEVMPEEPLVDKLEAFGLHVIEIDGHNLQAILDAFAFDTALHRKPVAIVAHTIPGKGVGFMENLPEWHGKTPTKPGEAVQALADIHEIRTLGGKIIGEHE